MSYTKSTFESMISQPVQSIQVKTIEEIDFTDILKYLNATIYMSEKIATKDSLIGELWNEIVYDLLASIHSASCGFYRSAIVVLRSVLELGCNSFFYLDHQIEYSIFRNANSKADKYVSVLINEYDFYKSAYIESFFPNIITCQIKQDSVSEFLKRIYASLSDVVHGRHNSLIKANGLEIKYEVEFFKRYQKLLFDTLSILAVMYALRFQDFSDVELVELSNKSGVVRL